MSQVLDNDIQVTHYRCGECKRLHSSRELAQACRSSHIWEPVEKMPWDNRTYTLKVVEV